METSLPPLSFEEAKSSPEKPVEVPAESTGAAEETSQAKV